MIEKKPCQEFLDWCHGYGNRKRLSEYLGCSVAAISQWGGIVPPERVPAVAHFTKIARATLRPDLYSREAGRLPHDG